MDDDRFWQTIEVAKRQYPDDNEMRVSAIRDHLSTLAPPRDNRLRQYGQRVVVPRILVGSLGGYLLDQRLRARILPELAGERWTADDLPQRDPRIGQFLSDF